MRKLLGFVAVLFGFLPVGICQIATTGAQVTDPDGQNWLYGQYQVQLVTPAGFIGTPIRTDTGFPFPTSFLGSMDNTGSFSVQLTENQYIKPAGTQWRFTVTPDVTGAPPQSKVLTINASGSVSSQINAILTAPRVTGGPGINAYSDIEVAAFAPNTYFNVLSQQTRCYTTSWGVCGGGGGATTPGGANTDVQVNAAGAFAGYPGLTFNSSTSALTVGTVASGRYAVLGLSDFNGTFTSLQLFDTCSGCGTTVDSDGVYAPSFQTGGGIIGGALLISGTSTVGTLQNGAPGNPITVNQNGGGAVALQVNGGVNTATLNGLTLSQNQTNGSVFLGNTDGGETQSVFVGVGAGSSVSGSTNQIVLGYGAQATASNQIILGNSAITTSTVYGTPTFPALAGAGGCAGLTSGGRLYLTSCGGGGGLSVLLSPGAGVSQTVNQQSGTLLSTTYFSAGSIIDSGLTSGTAPICPNGTGGAFTTTGCVLASGVSGLTSGYIPLAGSATTITGNSHLNDGVTTASTITSTETVAVPSLVLKGSSSGSANLAASATGSFLDLNGLGATIDTSGNAVVNSILGKVVSGISYTDKYSGATFGDRLNQCFADALALANLNTSYVCSARNETGLLSTTTPVIMGRSSGQPTIGLELPCNAVWTWNITDGVSVGFTQYGGTAVWDLCPSAGVTNAMNMAVGAGSSMKYLYQTVTSSQPYLTFSGFEAKNTSGTPTVSGVLFYLAGPLNDGSGGANLITYDTTDTYNVKAYNVSSAFMWQNSEFNGGNHTTPLFLFTDPSGYVQSVTFLNDTFVHPGTGNFAVYALDTRTSPTNKISGATFVAPYTETNPDGVTPSIGLSGWGYAHITSFWEKCYSTSGNCTAPYANVSNAYDTALIIDGGWCGRGQNDFTLPCTVVVNAYDGVAAGVVVSDANGHFDHYAPKSVPSWFGPITVPSVTTNGSGPGTITLSPFSASGTAIGSCTSANVNQQAMVSDATTFTFGATYASGGSNNSPVFCHYNGTSYAWVVY